MAPVEARAQCQVPHSASDARLCSVEASPAPWPFSRVVNKKELGLEAASEVIARTVTPEAEKYFHRIVQVAQSELEKLLIHKVQHIFDPVAAHSLKGMPAGMEGGSRRALLDKGANLNDPQKCKAKSAVEGQQLTAYVASVLGRIMVDFSRFADTVLRWQSQPSKGEVADGSNKQTCASSLQSSTAYQADTTEDLVTRLERQDKLNTELEDKYSNVMAELRQRKREFLMERGVFKERMRMLQALARESGDKALMQIMTHDVQFYEEGGVSVEDVKDEYERKLNDQEMMFQTKLRQKDLKCEEQAEELERLREALEELKKRKLNDNTANLESKLTKTEQMLEEAEEALRKALDENETLKVGNDGLMMQVNNLKAVVDGVNRQLEEQAAEATVKEKHLRAELADLQAQLQAAKAAQTKEPPKPPKPRCSRQFLRELSQSVAPDDRFERLQAELSAAKADLETLRSSSEDEAEKLRKALQVQAAATEKREVAESASQSDPWDPNKEDLAAAKAREAELLRQLDGLRAESQSLASALEAFQKAASPKTVTRDFGCGDGSVSAPPAAPPPVVHRQLLPADDSDFTSTRKMSLPEPVPENEVSVVDPPRCKPDEDLSAMFDYPRVATLGGGWLQGRRSQRKSGQSFTMAQTDRNPSPDQSGSPDVARSGSPQPDWETNRMPPELTSTGLGRGRSPSPGADSSTPLMVPLAAKALRSTVCSSPPPPGPKGETWPVPRAYSPDETIYETQSHQQDYDPSDGSPLPGRGHVWRSKASRSGHPLGQPSSRTATEQYREASDMFVEGERPPSAALAARRVRSRPTTAKPAQVTLASSESVAVESAQEKRLVRPSTASRGANHIDLNSCIAELPKRPRSGLLAAQRNAEQQRSTYGGGFVLLASDGSSRRQVSRAAEALRGRELTKQQSEAAGVECGRTMVRGDDGSHAMRPCSASRISRPSSGACSGLAGRMGRGDGTKSSGQLDDSAAKQLGLVRAAGALRPSMARHLSEQSLA